MYDTLKVNFLYVAWLEQDEKIDTPLESIESKTDLLMLHFGKFSQLWNEGKLDGMNNQVEKRREKNNKISKSYL